MNTLNKILCKTIHVICATADFIGVVVETVIKWTIHVICATADFIGVVVETVIKWTILSALALSVTVGAFLLWMSVPYFACIALFHEITSLWQLYAMIGIIVGWFILGKLVLDRLPSRK